MLGTTLLNRYRFGFAVREIRMALEFFATLVCAVTKLRFELLCAVTKLRFELLCAVTKLRFELLCAVTKLRFELQRAHYTLL
jgi:hypothetical protein